MIKQLDYAEDYSSVKYMDTSTSIQLLLTADGSPFDLSTCQSVVVQIANSDGYITSRDVSLADIDDPTSGKLTMPIDSELMNILTPDDYKIEVWVVIKAVSVTTTSRTATLSVIDGQLEPHTAIFPSDGVLGFSIDENLMNQDGDTIAVISMNEYEERFATLERDLRATVATLVGPKGDIGLQGEQGIQGIKGDKGDTGDIGPKGDQGIQGIQGIKGDKGDTGATGAIGPQGIQGPQGEQGIQGPKGDTGQGLEIKGKVDITSQLPATAAEGDGYLVGEELYVWTANTWKDCGQIQGPAGKDGAVGPQGLSGKDGTAGVQGPQGIQGPKGDKGDTGPQGIQGDTGAKGDKGDVGETGAQGLKGDTGTVNFTESANDVDAQAAAKALTEPGFVWFPDTEVQ